MTDWPGAPDEVITFTATAGLPLSVERFDSAALDAAFTAFERKLDLPVDRPSPRNLRDVGVTDHIGGDVAQVPEHIRAHHRVEQVAAQFWEALHSKG